jgi:hypothetical protein
VDLAQQALGLAEAFVPHDGSPGQEDLDGVPKSLQSDAQRVPSCGSALAHSASVQSPEFLIPLERQALSGQSVRRNEAARARSRRPGEVFPSALIELSHGTPHLVTGRRLALYQHVQELRSQRVACRRQLLHQGLEHVKIPQDAQCTKQLARKSPHRTPYSIAVDF